MKKIPIIAAMLLSLFVSSCQGNTGLDPINKNNIEINNKHFDFDGNFVTPELTIDGKDLEDEWHGDKVSDILTFSTDRTTVTTKMYRGKDALFFYFDVKDQYICAKGNNNGDDVSLSDSIEIYIDAYNDGGKYPNVDDYQINLGAHGKTRILVGSGRYWNDWNGLCNFEVNLKGTLNNNSDIDTGYSVEVMLP